MFGILLWVQNCGYSEGKFLHMELIYFMFLRFLKKNYLSYFVLYLGSYLNEAKQLLVYHSFRSLVHIGLMTFLTFLSLYAYFYVYYAKSKTPHKFKITRKYLIYFIHSDLFSVSTQKNATMYQMSEYILPFPILSL
jgi:hypothetical protein